MAFEQERLSLGNETNTVTLTGKGVLALPIEQRKAYARQVSATLATKPHTMLQYEPGRLLKSMQQGRSAVVTAGDHLAAFAQVWKYKYDLHSLVDKRYWKDILAERTVYEAGSWLSFAPYARQGDGQRVFQEAVAAGRAFDPSAFVIGIVEQNNIRARGIMEGMGGEFICTKPSPILKETSGKPATMIIYDVTNIDEIAAIQPTVQRHIFP